MLGDDTRSMEPNPICIQSMEPYLLEHRHKPHLYKEYEAISREAIGMEVVYIKELGVDVPRKAQLLILILSLSLSLSLTSTPNMFQAHLCSLDSSLPLENFTTKLTHMLHSTAIHNVPYTKHSNHSRLGSMPKNKWYDEDCRDLYSQLKVS